MPGVTFQQEGKIGIIEIDYPATLNSLNRELQTGLDEKLSEVAESDVRTVILKGSQRSFSTGGNLLELGTLSSPVECKEYVEEAHKLIRRIYYLPQVTIALVEGYAIGAGLSMALACDLIYAGENAKFSLPFINVGLVPDCGASYFLPRLVGMQKAKELAFTGKMIDAAEALNIGLIANVFPADAALEETKSLANQIAQGPAKALAWAKTNFDRAAQIGLEATLSLEEYAQGLCLLGEEHREKREAFLDRKRAEFQGK